MAAMAMMVKAYICWAYRTAYLENAVSASIRGITLSIGAVDSALTLWIAPAIAPTLWTVDSRLSHGSFKGRLRPQFDNDFLSRVRLC